MTELCGLELRQKACEAVGWRHQYWHSPSCDGNFLHCDYARHVDTAHLPAIESDPAVAWPLFLEWCKAKRLFWRMWPRLDGTIALELRPFEPSDNTRNIDVTGSNPCEAIARAIVKASEKP